MEYIENLILQYHNGTEDKSVSSEIIDLCWRSNDFLQGYLFFLHNRTITPVDFYILLSTLNGNNCARHSMELLNLAMDKERSDMTIGCWDHASLNGLYRSLKIWGHIILLETQSIMQLLQPKQLKQRITLNQNKEEPEKMLYMAYLKRALIFSTRNSSKDQMVYDEVSRYFSEVAQLFEKYSQFELMRTWLYEARMEGSIDRAKNLAEKAQTIATQLGFTRYKTLTKDELQRRSTQLLIRDGAFTDFFDKLKQELMAAPTTEQLFQLAAQVLRSRIIGRPIRNFSFLERNGLNVQVVLKEETDEVSATRQHVINTRYILVVPAFAHWALIEDLVQVLRIKLTQLENGLIFQNMTVIKDDLIVYSSGMDNFVTRCREIADLPHRAVPVLITGETGTGKSWLAEKLHSVSPVTQRGGLQHWFASENKGGDINMFKSNLFGFVAGFANQLKKDQPGKVQLAQDGSLIMDEIGELELDRQVVLLQLLNNWRYERVGDPTTYQADCRIYLATNKDLKKMVVDGTFREDLYFRISMDTLHVPALRSFPEQILPLARVFGRQEIQALAQAGYSESPLSSSLVETGLIFTPEAEQLMESYSWPGNIRQLKLFLRMLVSSLFRKQKFVVDEKSAQEMFHRLQESDPFAPTPQIVSDQTSFVSFQNNTHLDRITAQAFGTNKYNTFRKSLIDFVCTLEHVPVTSTLLVKLEKGSRIFAAKKKVPGLEVNSIQISSDPQLMAYLTMQAYLNLIIDTYKLNGIAILFGIEGWKQAFRRLYLNQSFKVVQQSFEQFEIQLRSNGIITERLIDDFCRSMQSFIKEK